MSNPTLNIHLRKWIANKLAGWARRIYPPSVEVMSFYQDRMLDMVITGQSTVKVEAVPYAAIAHLSDGAVWVLGKDGDWKRQA